MSDMFVQKFFLYVCDYILILLKTITVENYLSSSSLIHSDQIHGASFMTNIWA